MLGTRTSRLATFFVHQFKAFRLMALVAIGILAGAAGYFATQYLNGNFNAVVAGEFYRSAQLTPSQLRDVVKLYGIRTIINLRGPNAGQDWYDREVEATNRLGITHLDFAMSAKRDLPAGKANQLIDLMRQAEKPILIHCQAGADRSGLAAALYLAAIKKADEATSEAQLSIRYGHIALPIASAFAMDQSFESIEPQFGFPGA